MMRRIFSVAWTNPKCVTLNNDFRGNRNLEKIHHIALTVGDINEALEWYCENFACKPLYRDETWALLAFDNISLALVLADQHPPHFAVIRENAESHGSLTPHRDGTASVYVRDPWNNAIEFMKMEPAA